jgi:hypothetical protein
MILVYSWRLRARPGKRGWLIQGEGMADPQGRFSLHGLAADDGKVYWVQKLQDNGLSFRLVEGQFDLTKRLLLAPSTIGMAFMA